MRREGRFLGATQSTPLKPLAEAEESAAGYLLRLLSTNGLLPSRRRVDSHGLRFERVVLGCPASGEVDLLGDAWATCAAWTASEPSNTRVRLRGEVLHRHDLTTMYRRWCPACWAQDLAGPPPPHRPRYWRLHRRGWWDVAAIETCPDHAVRLRDRCTLCARVAKWADGLLHHCRCGADLALAPGAGVGHDEGAADRYILGRLRGVPQGVPLLDDLPLGRAIGAMVQFGRAAVGAAGINMADVPKEEWAGMNSAGFAVALDWPAGFDRALDVTAAPASSASWYAAHRYGSLHTWARDLTGPFGDTVRQRMNDHHELWKNTRLEKSNRLDDDERPVSVQELAGRCKVHHIYVLLFADYLGKKPHKVIGQPSLFDRENSDAIYELLAVSVSLQNAAAILGLSKSQTLGLYRSGLLQDIFNNLDSNKHNYRRFWTTGVQCFLDELLNKARLNDVPVGDTVALLDVARSRGSHGFGEVVRRIWSGTIVATRSEASSRSILALEVPRTAVKRRRCGATLQPRPAALFGGPGRGGEPPSAGSHPPSEVPGLPSTFVLKWVAAKRLGIDPATVTAAVTAGLFTRPSSDKGARPRLTEKSVRQFEAQYVAFTQIRAASGLGRGQVLALLKDAGARPALSRSDHPRSKTNIWRISDLPESLSKHFIT